MCMSQTEARILMQNSFKNTSDLIEHFPEKSFIPLSFRFVKTDIFEKISYIIFYDNGIYQCNYLYR